MSWDGTQAKELWERLDTVYAALPDTARDDFVQAVDDLCRDGYESQALGRRWIKAHQTRTGLRVGPPASAIAPLPLRSITTQVDPFALVNERERLLPF